MSKKEIALIELEQLRLKPVDWSTDDDGNPDPLPTKDAVLYATRWLSLIPDDELETFEIEVDADVLGGTSLIIASPSGERSCWVAQMNDGTSCVVASTTDKFGASWHCELSKTSPLEVAWWLRTGVRFSDNDDIPFRTTDKQKLELWYFVGNMLSKGLTSSFVNEIQRIGEFDQGVFDLAQMWTMTDDLEERVNITLELRASIDDYARFKDAVSKRPEQLIG